MRGSEVFKAYAGQNKIISHPRGLSHLSRPPVSFAQDRRVKKKEKEKTPKKELVPHTSPSKENREWQVNGVQLFVLRQKVY
jgi:hypothetical protein